MAVKKISIHHPNPGFPALRLNLNNFYLALPPPPAKYSGPGLISRNDWMSGGLILLISEGI